jgi:hypothetical protein
MDSYAKLSQFYEVFIDMIQLLGYNSKSWFFYVCNSHNALHLVHLYQYMYLH